ncbi:hypothetical protein K5D39_05755 [Pseudomonas cichorii]|nr:hypothetical protein [Pseudomonas cichorii]
MADIDQRLDRLHCVECDSGFGICIANRFEHYRAVNQLDAQQITETDVHCCKDIWWEINDNVPAAVAWILTRYSRPH